MSELKQIRTNHMKKRCMVIFVMCFLSLYCWFNYSLFDPIDSIVNNKWSLYYLNCVIMILYLLWDTYHMTLSSNKKALYRTDLIIHHVVSLIVYLSYINNTTLQMSHVLLMESISLMNYVWRNRPTWLKTYRTLCIFLIRIPMSLFFLCYYNPSIQYPHLRSQYSCMHRSYLCSLGHIYYFFLLYDMFLLWKIHKPK